VGGTAGFDWRRNRAWLALVALLAVGVVITISRGDRRRLLSASRSRWLFAALAAGALAGLGQVSRRASSVPSPASRSPPGGPPAMRQPPYEPPEGASTGGDETDPTVVTFAGILVLVTYRHHRAGAALMRDAPIDEGNAEERMIDPEPRSTPGRACVDGASRPAAGAPASGERLPPSRRAGWRSPVARLAAESPPSTRAACAVPAPVPRVSTAGRRLRAGAFRRPHHRRRDPAGACPLERLRVSLGRGA
jgi:hypothetical protein